MKSTVNNRMSNQRGLTLISWIIILVFLLFQGVIAMKLVPVYMTDLSVKKIMDSLPSDPTALQTPATGLKAVVAKRLSINSVYVVKPSHIKVKRSHGKNIVTIEYEPRGVLFGNLEYIVHFKHEAEIKGP